MQEQALTVAQAGVHHRLTCCPHTLTWVGEAHYDTSWGEVNAPDPHVHVEGGKHVQGGPGGVPAMQLL